MSKTTELVETVDQKFSLRGKSYKEGMLLLLAHLTEQDWKAAHIFPTKSHLKKQVEALYFNYLNALDKAPSFSERKKCFDGLLASYDSLLADHTKLKDSFESLRVAERCAVWQKGRDISKTIVGDVVQQEAPGADHKLLFEEYKQVDNAEPPSWLQLLPSWQQSFIKANWQELHTKSIPSSLRHVPGVANFSQHSLIIKGQKSISYNRHATPLPVDLLERAAAEQEAFRLACLNISSQIRISLDQQLTKQTTAQTHDEVVILTQSLLSPGTMATLKSQHISDSSDNDTQIYEMKEKVVELFRIALKDPNDEENKAFLKRQGLAVADNGSLQYEGHAIKKISLLSTNHPYNILRRFGTHPIQIKRNDENTAQMLAAVSRYLLPIVAREESLKSSKGDGFGLSLARDLAPKNAEFLNLLIARLAVCATKNTVSEKDKEDLLEIFEKFGDDRTIKVLFNNGHDKNTAKLLSAVKSLLSIPSGQGSFEMDARHRQSLVSAMEVIIVHYIGGTPWIACKSGKDRTGGASAAIDAAELFYEQHGRFPRYADSQADRACYLQSLKVLFESGHHQAVASQNAPGAGGLVNPSTFLPDDLKLDADTIQGQTQLARLNKPKKRKLTKKVFNHHSLRKELNAIKGDSMTVLRDWRSNWNNYFIEGVSIESLRNGKPFENREDLEKFFEEKLLYKIQDKSLKKAYLALALDSFHQGGFQHVLGHLFFKLQTQQNDSDSRVEVIYGKSKDDYQINFSPLENGVQVQEVNTYDTKNTIQKCGDGDAVETSPKHGGFYYQTNSCLSVVASMDKGGYKLDTVINEVNVDCADERLEPILCRERTLIEVLIDIFKSLVELFKHWGLDKGKAHEDGLPADSSYGVVAGNSRLQTSDAKLVVSVLSLSPTPPAITLLGFVLCKGILMDITSFFMSKLRIDLPLTAKVMMAGGGAFFKLPAPVAKSEESHMATTVPAISVGA